MRVVCPIPLGAPSAQRSVSAYGTLGIGTNNALTFFVGADMHERRVASAFPCGEGGAGVEDTGDG